MKKVFCLVIAFALFGFGGAVSAATTVIVDTSQDNSPPVRRVETLDVSKGYVKGLNIPFTFTIPEQWKDNIYAEREITAGAGAVEQLNFNCRSFSQRYKPQLLMSLYIFHKSAWEEKTGFDTVMVSKDYVFACQRGDKNSFSLDVDRVVYQSCYKEISANAAVGKLISLPREQQEDSERTVMVNGTPLVGKLEMIDKTYYIPFREACEAMGYSVTWLEAEGAIRVTRVRDNFLDKFAINKSNGSDARGIKMRIIKDRAYVSTAYFYSIMGMNIDIDERKNIYMNSN